MTTPNRIGLGGPSKSIKSIKPKKAVQRVQADDTERADRVVPVDSDDAAERERLRKQREDQERKKREREDQERDTSTLTADVSVLGHYATDVQKARLAAGLDDTHSPGLLGTTDMSDPTYDEAKDFQVPTDSDPDGQAVGGRISDTVRSGGEAVGKGVQGLGMTAGMAAEMAKEVPGAVGLTLGRSFEAAHAGAWAIHDKLRPSTPDTYETGGEGTVREKGRTTNPTALTGLQRTIAAGEAVNQATLFTRNPDQRVVAPTGLYAATAAPYFDEAKDFETPGGSPYVAPDPEFVTLNPAEFLPGIDLARATEDDRFAGWRDYGALALTAADVVPGAVVVKGGKVVRTAARVARGDILEATTDLGYVPRLVTRADDPAAHAASLALRDQAFRTGRAAAEYGGKIVTVPQKPLDRIIRQANPDLMVDEGLLTHASPNVKPFQQGGPVPEFPAKGADEQGTFGVPGAAGVPRFTDKAAFGQRTTRLDSPGFAVMRLRADDVTVPGSTDHPFFTKHYAPARGPAGYENELIVPTGGQTPAIRPTARLSGDSFAWTGQSRLYLDESLQAPSYTQRVGAHIQAGAQRLKDPKRGQGAFGIRQASPEEVARSRYGKNLDQLTREEAHVVDLTQQSDGALRKAAVQGDASADEIVKARDSLNEALQSAERTADSGRDAAGRQVFARQESGLYTPARATAAVPVPDAVPAVRAVDDTGTDQRTDDDGTRTDDQGRTDRDPDPDPDRDPDPDPDPDRDPDPDPDPDRDPDPDPDPDRDPDPDPDPDRDPDPDPDPDRDPDPDPDPDRDPDPDPDPDRDPDPDPDPDRDPDPDPDPDRDPDPDPDPDRDPDPDPDPDRDPDPDPDPDRDPDPDPDPDRDPDPDPDPDRDPDPDPDPDRDPDPDPDPDRDPDPDPDPDRDPDPDPDPDRDPDPDPDPDRDPDPDPDPDRDPDPDPDPDRDPDPDPDPDRDPPVKPPRDELLNGRTGLPPLGRTTLRAADESADSPQTPQTPPRKPDTPAGLPTQVIEAAPRPDGTFARRIAHRETVEYSYDPETDRFSARVVQSSRPVVTGWDQTPPQRSERAVGGWDVTPSDDGVTAEANNRVTVPEGVRDRLRQQAGQTGEAANVTATERFDHDLDTGATTDASGQTTAEQLAQRNRARQPLMQTSAARLAAQQARLNRQQREQQQPRNRRRAGSRAGRGDVKRGGSSIPQITVYSEPVNDLPMRGL